MSSTQQPVLTNPPTIVICDTNVVLLMTVFKSSVMFAAAYSFGQIKIHQIVIDELEGWLGGNNKKVQKFTKAIIQQAVDLSQSVSGGIKEATPEQHKKSMSYITAKEGSLSAQEKGVATSPTDKDLLILAYVNRSYLATQERTMTAVANKTLPPGKVLRFEDLVIDLIKLKKLTPEDVRSGLGTLEYFKETLAYEKRKEIDRLLEH